MAPLKHLEKENPIIDASFRYFCASHGILTVEDFLLHDLEVLAAFSDRQTNSDRLKEAITVMLSLVERQCHSWLNGMELLEDLQRNKHILSTGDIGTDSLLKGGFREGLVTELVGPSSSGKTQFCMQAAASVAEKHDGRVLYLDTGNSFSARRIAQFGSSSDTSLGQKFMSRISCHTVYDIYTLLETLQGLDVTLRSQVQTNVSEHRLRLLVVDSISSLITPILGGSGSQGRALMVAVGYMLKKLAHEHSIAILVTNHTVGAGGEGGKTKPALGETWKSIPHVRLMLSRDHKNSNCTISILKHTSMPSGQTMRITTHKDNR
ncbi:PREDICTED: DNA repair protein RAD51 homolog 4-like isoform X2 [Camelina sativa]|uniref:DNA repair protein RAD51 homolog 4-like isoform X1 n=1 Tax=Camelina sativa TaxID=90675 RepID=A0ABM1RIQ4_CAMSA|nr:PREDICTED: DNA repair protein RAD51 homolog 4-like isoform X1 [Camelina sativa]XP_019098892.1 PREDICTED: DNA repair protein RAD51 homolog 4-like isoform X2 [Camelina sativa]